MKTYKSFTSEIILVTEKTESYVPKAQIKESKDVYEFIKPLWPVDLKHREAVMAIFLNRRNNTVGFAIVGIGGLASCVADGKVMFQQALLCNASAIIMAHNHPSGELKPSESDKLLTRKMQEFGKFIDMNVLDHLIVTDERFTSFADEGLI
jgi:DNA repair protein RadC